jgi:hypothetical protein
MRTVWTGLAIAAAVALGSVAATALAQDGKAGNTGSGLGEKPALQGESWMGSTGSQDPALGERRTDKQKNAVETKDQGRIGKVPDASKGETGLKGEAGGSGADSAGSGSAGRTTK